MAFYCYQYWLLSSYSTKCVFVYSRFARMPSYPQFESAFTDRLPFPCIWFEICLDQQWKVIKTRNSLFYFLVSSYLPHTPHFIDRVPKRQERRCHESTPIGALSTPAFTSRYLYDIFPRPIGGHHAFDIPLIGRLYEERISSQKLTVGTHPLCSQGL